MKLAQALAAVVRTPANETGCDTEALMEALDLETTPNWDTVAARLRCYWISRWLADGISVGCKAIYLDDAVVGYSKQAGRKTPVDLKFLAADRANAVRAWLIACAEKPSRVAPPVASERELATDIGVDFTVDLACAIHDREGYFQGDRADLLSVPETDNLDDRTAEIETVLATHVVSVPQFRMPLHLNSHWPLQRLTSEAP